MSKISQNLKENFMGSMSGKIAAGALVFTTAFLPMTGNLGNTFDGIANAQDKPPVTKVAGGWDKATPASLPSNKREAWMDASDYSAAHRTVAFAVNGRTPDATNAQIAEFIRERLAENGVASVYFTGREDKIGVSFSFFIDGYNVRGPVGLPKMMPTIQEVTEYAKGFEATKAEQLTLAR